jgi:predicted aspartyl protease
VPVTLYRNTPIVNGSFDGAPLTLMIDTGAQGNVLTEQAARRIGAQTDWNKPSLSIGIAGYVMSYELAAKRIAVADAFLDDQPFHVSATPLPSEAGKTTDGLLGGEFLKHFDIDFDLPHGRITFYRGRNCPAAAPPWTEDFSALATPAVWSPAEPRPFVAATLNGHRIIGMLDSGAQVFAVSRSVAASVGVSADSLSNDRAIEMRGVTADIDAARIHRFDSLIIGPDRFRNVDMVVTRENGAGPGFLVGAVYLRQRRVWISYASQKIFVGAPAPVRAVAEALPTAKN